MTAAAIAVVAAAVVVVVVLLLTLLALLRTVQLLQTTVGELHRGQRDTMELAADVRRDLADARRAAEPRPQAVALRPAAIGALARGPARPVTEPVVKVLAFGAGTARAAHKLRQSRAQPTRRRARRRR